MMLRGNRWYRRAERMLRQAERAARAEELKARLDYERRLSALRLPGEED